MGAKVRIPKPIFLSSYENTYLKIRGELPQRFLDRLPEDTYSQRVRVQWKDKRGSQHSKSLWEVSDPNAGIFHDGKLDYREALGKTFWIPNYFCNNPGFYVHEIRNATDFKHLRDALMAPMGNEFRRPFRCTAGETKKKSSVNKTEQGDYSPELVFPESSSLRRMIESMQWMIREDLEGLFEEKIREYFESRGEDFPFSPLGYVDLEADPAY